MTLTKEDINNLLILITKASITGADALAVAQLQQKLTAMAQETEVLPDPNLPNPKESNKK